MSPSTVSRAWRRYQGSGSLFLTGLSSLPLVIPKGWHDSPTSSSGTCAHNPWAPLAFASKHKNWQIRHWHLVLFTDESRFTLSTCDRRARLWRCRGVLYAACNIIVHDWLSSGSVMVWGGPSLECCTDLHVTANGTLTAVRYKYEILGVFVRPCTDVVAYSWCRRMPGASSSWMMKALMPVTVPSVPLN